MWSNQKSIEVAAGRERSFSPPYCANEHCPWHDPQVSKSQAVFHKFGRKNISRFPYISQRFRCTSCLKTFSASFFFLCYRDRREDFYEEIYDLRQRGISSKRQIAKFLECSLDTVLRRQQKMARWSLLRLAKDTENLLIRESVAYDGLENFSFSQYEPNNINHAVGRESLFVYDFNFSAMNRKGRMSHGQRVKKKKLEERYGSFPKDAITDSSWRVFSRLFSKSAGSTFELHTDCHYAYQRALQKMRATNVNHFMTRSRKGRNYRNRLFAVNHLDLLTRHHLSDFKRETIAFAKTSISMQESFVSFVVFKNYMRPKFEKIQKTDPRSNAESPAMALCLTKKILSFREFFRMRITKRQVSLGEDWLNLFERRDPHSRHIICPYNGIKDGLSPSNATFFLLVLLFLHLGRISPLARAWLFKPDKFTFNTYPFTINACALSASLLF